MLVMAAAVFAFRQHKVRDGSLYCNAVDRVGAVQYYKLDAGGSGGLHGQ
jgi:hypothetical protein